MVIRQSFGRVLSFLLLAALVCFTLAARAESEDVSAAQSALLQGRVDQASSLLKAILASQSSNSLAHQLLCRVYYAQDLPDPAVHECELAVSNSPNDSDNQLWLGRTYGLKASHSGPFAGLSLAKKVRESFEGAVQLNPESVHASSDLGEFYVSAPGLVGGGLDKARALAERMQQHFPSQAHRLLALIAGKRNDSATQEAEFKTAVSLSRSAAAYIDLASFYANHNQPDLALTTIRTSITANRVKDPSLVDAASILTKSKQSTELAERCLREYLASPAKTDEAPAFKVHLQLGDLLAHRGDNAGAHAEYAAALALASNYAPARKAIKSP